MYLHLGGSGFVPGPTYAWQGTESQLAAARRDFPDAADLVEEPVAKWQPRDHQKVLD